MEYLNSMDLRVGLQFGDWLSYATNDTKKKEYLSYVYTIWDAQMMQEIAQVLAKRKTLPNGKRWKKNILALQGPCISMKTALVNAIKNNGNKLNTGFLGTSIIMEVLVNIGETELAYELLFQDADPSWLYSVKQGATTTWERWNSYTKANGFGAVGMNSFNHYAYGCVGEFMYNIVLGINPDGAGYKKILIAPETTDKLTFARGSYDSANGLIESAWELGADGLYDYTFTVPMNTTATIKLEKQAYGVYEAAGATFLKEENGYVYYDHCSDYVDIAVHITNILSANGGDIGIITRTYVKLADGTVCYGDVCVSSYNQANG